MCSRLSQIEKDIGKLEKKERLTNTFEPRTVKRLKEIAKEHGPDFEQHHVQVLNFIDSAEDAAALESEETVLDKHVNRFSDITEQLEQLEDPVATIYRACDASCN